MTPSIRHALEDLRLARVVFIYPGAKWYAIAERVEAVLLRTIGEGKPIFSEGGSN